MEIIVPKPLTDLQGSRYLLEVYKKKGDSPPDWSPSVNNMVWQAAAYREMVEKGLTEMKMSYKYRIAPQLLGDTCMDCGNLENGCFCGDGFKREER